MVVRIHHSLLLTILTLLIQWHGGASPTVFCINQLSWDIDPHVLDSLEDIARVNSIKFLHNGSSSIFSLLHHTLMNVGIHLLNVIEVALRVDRCHRFSFCFRRGLSWRRLEAHLRHLRWLWGRKTSLISLLLRELEVLSPRVIKIVIRRLVS